jgi:competence protein ComEC
MLRFNYRTSLIFIGILLLLNVFAWKIVFDISSQKYLEVDFFDVGQGDAAFIETPQNHQILIDGGPNSEILKKLGKEMPFYDRTLDMIILSHPEKDHLFGLLEVLERYKVDYIVWTGIVRQTPEYQEWQELLKIEGAKIIIAKAGEIMKAGNVLLSILYPAENLEGKEVEDSNDTSIVLRLSFGKNSFLFTGDATNKTEQELVSEKSNLESDILKVSHHGSKYSTSDIFLENVKPKIAVVSVGKNNSYGHPTSEVLQRLQKFGIDILRTDINGDIKFYSNGENLLYGRN